MQLSKLSERDSLERLVMQLSMQANLISYTYTKMFKKYQSPEFFLILLISVHAFLKLILTNFSNAEVLSASLALSFSINKTYKLIIKNNLNKLYDDFNFIDKALKKSGYVLKRKGIFPNVLIAEINNDTYSLKYNSISTLYDAINGIGNQQHETHQ